MIQRFILCGVVWCGDAQTDAIHEIRNHGGVSILAHPKTLGISSDALLQELGFLLQEAPLDGIEAYSSRHSLGEARQYHFIAEYHDLLITGGSDYHGRNKEGVELGNFGGGHEEWIAEASLRYKVSPSVSPSSPHPVLPFLHTSFSFPHD